MATVGVEALSAPEAEILASLREHRTNAEIAQTLHISVRTVESHVSSLLRKLAVQPGRGPRRARHPRLPLPPPTYLGADHG